MNISDLYNKINQFDKLVEKKDIPLIAISQSNIKSSKKFFEKFFEISDGGNPNYDS